MNLNQITIPSVNVSQATVFYKKLGLKLIVEALPIMLGLSALKEMPHFQSIK